MIPFDPFALFQMWVRGWCAVAAVHHYTLADAYNAGAAPEGVWPDITRQYARETGNVVRFDEARKHAANRSR